MPKPIGGVCRIAPLDGVTPPKILDGPLYLPALLNDLTFEEEFDHTDFTTHRAGEFSIPSQGGETARRLRPFTPEFLTLDWEAPWLTEYRDPEEIQDILTAVGRSKRAVELLCVVYRGRGVFNERARSTRMNVTLRRAAETVKPGEADTRYWQIELKEWRQLTGGRLTTTAKWPKRHKLLAATTLHGLAKRYYGSVGPWRAIAAKNKLQGWGAATPIVNHKRFKVGDTVIIPEPPAVFISDPGNRAPGTGSANTAPAEPL